jgi:DnaK suppressor protein
MFTLSKGAAMTDTDREELRKLLSARGFQILEQGRRLVEEAAAAPSVRTDVDDFSEVALDDAMQTTRHDLGERERAVLVLVRAALERMNDGTYGRCIDCGEEIDLERLRSIPWAPRCQADQDRYEEEHRVASPTL